MAGYGRGFGKGGGHGKGGHYQRDLNDVHLQAASGKIPPTWSPEGSKNYSLRAYERDLRLWAASTDTDPVRMGPLIALRLGGSARILAREMDVGVLANGMLVPDPAQGGLQVQLTGPEFILRQLRRRYAPLDQEVQITAIADIFHFRKNHSESTDELIARFELTLNEAELNGQVVFPETLKAWMLLSVLAIPKAAWSLLLAPTQGALPMNQQEYTMFQQYIRRNGHLYENQGSGGGIQQPFFAGDATPYDQQSDFQQYHSDQLQPAQNYWGQSGGLIDTESNFDELSSGNSNDDEPVDYSAEAHLTQELAGEQLYLGYRVAKRKFRKFTRHPGRGRKGGGGKSKGKGKGKPVFYWDDDSFAYLPVPDEQAYAFQKGAKAAGKGGPRKNPIGSDGKIMTCSICKSEDHFQRFCPRNPKGKGKGTSGYHSEEQPGTAPVHWSQSASGHWSQDASAMPGTQGAIYLALPVQDARSSTQFHATIEYEDGTLETLATSTENALRQAAYENTSTFQAVEQANPVNYEDLTPSQRTMWQFPWWTEVYHTQVRLSTGQEGILVDCGAMSDLCGDRVAQRIIKLAEDAGQGTTWKKIPDVSVEGVGSGKSIINDLARIPLCFVDGKQAIYEAIVARDSDLPALWGLNRMTVHQVVIDTGNDRLIFPGPDGIKYTLSPGSRVYKLQRAISGHLLLPCAEWKNAKRGAGGSAPATLF